MATRYSVDVSMLFLCVITRPFSHFDDDLLPRVTALLSKLVFENSESYNISDVKIMRDYAYTNVQQSALTCTDTSVFRQAYTEV